MNELSNINSTRTSRLHVARNFICRAVVRVIFAVRMDGCARGLQRISRATRVKVLPPAAAVPLLLLLLV